MYFIERMNSRPREVAWQLGILADLPEDSSSVPRICIGPLTIAYNSS